MALAGSGGTVSKSVPCAKVSATPAGGAEAVWHQDLGISIDRIPQEIPLKGQPHCSCSGCVEALEGSLLHD